MTNETRFYVAFKQPGDVERWTYTSEGMIYPANDFIMAEAFTREDASRACHVLKNALPENTQINAFRETNPRFQLPANIRRLINAD